jgi:two-component sensor histidine kinase
MKAVHHPDEEARLAALRSYDILDSDSEAEFDEIVRVVAQVCGMPVSLISLVDADRQWFKAKSGVDLTGTPLEMSVCAHGILQPDLLEIEDMTKDVRTIDNPLVKGDPNARFYAGAALTNDAGYPLGMLCVLDYQPRKLNETQREVLQVMAKVVMRQIELRKRLKTEQHERVMVQDILSKANALLARNDTLRREIDHRVKNSLTQVAAFLRIQEKQYKDQPQVAEPLAEARGRVVAVANVHDHLHRAAEDDVTSVAQFLRNLTEAVSQNRSAQLRAIEIDAGETRLRSDKIMAIGLAVNEFIANAIKHGFPPGHDGVITISFHDDADGTHVLRMADNGVGLPADCDIKAGKGLGMRVMTSLAQQLGGTLEHAGTGPGTQFVLRFPPGGA